MKGRKLLAGGLNRQPLSVQIAERIIEEISNGTYAAGSSLPSEQALSVHYNVSRPVVREAFKFLSAQGFVNVNNGKEASIREVDDELLCVFFRRVLGRGSDRDVQDLFEVRMVLENMSAAQAAANRTEQELMQLRETLDSMMTFIDQPAIYSGFDVKFHILLAQASHNIFLFHLISAIRETLMSLASNMRLEISAAQIALIQDYHEQIYRAVKSGAPLEAKKAMDNHFNTAMERLAKNLQSRSTMRKN
jgi:GntR family transcriptional repressor for pyruvate dehydrogenase complex